MSLYQILNFAICHDVNRERTTLLVEYNFHRILEALANLFTRKTHILSRAVVK